MLKRNCEDGEAGKVVNDTIDRRIYPDTCIVIRLNISRNKLIFVRFVYQFCLEKLFCLFRPGSDTSVGKWTRGRLRTWKLFRRISWLSDFIACQY